MRRILAVVLAVSPLLAQVQRKPGSPLDALPKNIEILTHFGERADISPDNQRVAFMNKSFGDAFIIDLKTRAIRCLTCNVPATAFLRVMHLSNGDFVLIGPEKFRDIRVSRREDNELWFLSSKPGSKPVKLGQKMSEGVALSKKSLKIAYSEIHDQNPQIPEGASRMTVADFDPSGPRLINKRVVHESPDNRCTIEPQDFYDNDTKLTFSCYEPKGMASVMTIDLKTSQVVNQSKTPGTYNEPEGIFPDGVYTLVEADRQTRALGGEPGGGNIDIWKLKLDGTGKDYQRLTHFNDYEGGKASNPVVSTDGRFMSFQFARTTDPAGVGYGLLIYWFK
jgi:hypothetical protein